MDFFADIKQEFRDIYRYRYVVYSYIQTNLRLRYRRSYLGFIWTVLAPLLNYLVMGVVFSLIMHNRMEGFFPYYFTGAVFFAVIASVINRSPSFLISNEHFIKKIYLPKLTFVLNGTLYEFTNFCLSVLALFVLGAFAGQLHLSIYSALAFIPLLFVLFFLVGIGCIVSVATVYFRDLNHIIPVTIQSLFFVSPILYERSMIPEKYQFLVGWNPIYYFLETFRQPLIYGKLPPLNYYVISFSLAAISFLMGIFIIKKFDNRIVFKL